MAQLERARSGAEIRTDSIHVNAFAQLDPREAIVRCGCGERLGPENFVGITMNHASLEACLRWWCPASGSNVYAPIPIGLRASYRPVFRSWLGELIERNGQEIHVLFRAGLAAEGVPLYVVQFPDDFQHKLTGYSFQDPKQYAEEVRRYEP